MKNMLTLLLLLVCWSLQKTKAQSLVANNDTITLMQTAPLNNSAFNSVGMVRLLVDLAANIFFNRGKKNSSGVKYW